MAVTVTITKRDKIAQSKVAFGTVLLDSSYPTNGEACAQKVLGIGDIDFIAFTNQNGYVAQYDKANEKIVMYASAGTEVTNTTDLSGVTLQYMAFGK